MSEQEARERIEKALIRFADQEVENVVQGYFLPLDPRSIITKKLIEIEFIYCFSPDTPNFENIQGLFNQKTLL
jgi:hypothetical protein